MKIFLEKLPLYQFFIKKPKLFLWKNSIFKLSIFYYEEEFLDEYIKQVQRHYGQQY
ncbi:hypothetical protein CHCC20488_0862 [Bacillus paralicheniformis]|nr:hypothetical protein SC10_B2orf01008 [Bacillus paralicheniformis]OLG03289.1 hypothetical protein B4125_3533 [Bacillus paralicheniformis]TWM03044.1 hypothetical protein CHCC15136_0341 [Bacillus paralicheniformis]TWN34315.1 hypothetical protein CHCC14527_0978 [Bacillus paralicheniformis]TWO02915.1 hypothetical protein CHCC20488_0862 [Bacillus paralicheniformis]